MNMDIETIHDSLVNGQRRQMVQQIEDYGLYEFWPDYKHYLLSLYSNIDSVFNYFYDATNSYFKITCR